MFGTSKIEFKEAIDEWKNNQWNQVLSKERKMIPAGKWLSSLLYAALKRLKAQGLLNSLEGRGMSGRAAQVWEPIGIIDDDGYINKDWKPSYK